MRVVIDTNVYVSAVVYGSLPRTVLERGEHGDFEIAVSHYIRQEVERVLRDKFEWSPKWISRALKSIWASAFVVVPRRTISICRDASDNGIIECAAEAGAQVIVTYDKDLLSLTAFEGILILKSRQFIELLDSLSEG